MAFAVVSVVIMDVHARFDFYLFVGDFVGASFAIESHCLSRITDGFDAAVIEFLQSCWNTNLNSWHRWKPWLIHTSKCRSKQAAFNFSTASVANIEERVVLQKVVIEYLIAILLINIPTMKLALSIFHASSEYIRAILVENCFPLC